MSGLFPVSLKNGPQIIPLYDPDNIYNYNTIQRMLFNHVCRSSYITVMLMWPSMEMTSLFLNDAN